MPNAPAKRAAYLMIAIGVVLLAGSFVSTMYALLNPDWLKGQLAAHREALGDNPLLQGKTLLWIVAISGTLGLLESGLSIVLGLYILRGKHWAIVTSLVLTILRLLIVGLLALLVVLAMVLERAMRTDAGAPAPATSMTWDLVLGIGSTAVLVLLAVWLIQAMRWERRHETHALLSS